MNYKFRVFTFITTKPGWEQECERQLNQLGQQGFSLFAVQPQSKVNAEGMVVDNRMAFIMQAFDGEDERESWR